MMEYPKPIMKMSELMSMGFPEEYLLYAYRYPRQRFAGKMNPTKKNSAIIFDTAAFDSWRIKQIEAEARQRVEQIVGGERDVCTN